MLSKVLPSSPFGACEKSCSIPVIRGCQFHLNPGLLRGGTVRDAPMVDSFLPTLHGPLCNSKDPSTRWICGPILSIRGHPRALVGKDSDYEEQQSQPSWWQS
ncbi:UNVERIFIED_CONTAM: hypothetical protein K2H54_030247 [Gekko kuhli]